MFSDSVLFARSNPPQGIEFIELFTVLAYCGCGITPKNPVFTPKQASRWQNPAVGCPNKMVFFTRVKVCRQRHDRYSARRKSTERLTPATKAKPWMPFSA